MGNRTQQQDMVRAIDASGMRPVIDKQFPVENIADAFPLPRNESVILGKFA